MTSELRSMALGLFSLVRQRALTAEHFRTPRKLQEFFSDLARAQGAALLGADIVKAAYVLDDEGLVEVVMEHRASGQFPTVALTPKGKATSTAQARAALLPELTLMN